MVDAAVLLTQFEIPLEVVEAAISSARGLVVANPAPYQPFPPSTLRDAYVCVPNLPEFAAICGVANVALDEVEQLLMRAPVAGSARCHPEGDGAVVRTPEAREVVWVRAPATDVVDTPAPVTAY
ncbi:hypothetical protein ACJ5H2_22040 (plasmid) [Nocardioides sp. R1-1]|uniref:hypothetical protein n=1 Tax=Nocardioides sp. R1-1 TaxID=3383502 RepID=UPI0038D0D118